MYIFENIVPRGLRLRFEPPFKNDSAFLTDWNDYLHTCSMGLLLRLKTKWKSLLDNLNPQISTLTLDLKSNTKHGLFTSFDRTLTSRITSFEKDTMAKKLKKLQTGNIKYWQSTQKVAFPNASTHHNRTPGQSERPKYRPSAPVPHNLKHTTPHNLSHVITNSRYKKTPLLTRPNHPARTTTDRAHPPPHKLHPLINKPVPVGPHGHLNTKLQTHPSDRIHTPPTTPPAHTSSAQSQDETFKSLCELGAR